MRGGREVELEVFFSTEWDVARKAAVQMKWRLLKMSHENSRTGKDV